MPNNKEANKSGGVVISSGVISSIAINATKDIEGVAGLSSNNVQIKGMLNKMSGKPSSVIISMENSELVITVYIKIKDGYNIQSVASKVQTSVKQAVQNMTGKVVAKVNVTVADLVVGDAEEE